MFIVELHEKVLKDSKRQKKVVSKSPIFVGLTKNQTFWPKIGRFGQKSDVFKENRPILSDASDFVGDFGTTFFCRIEKLRTLLNHSAPCFNASSISLTKTSENLTGLFWYFFSWKFRKVWCFFRWIKSTNITFFMKCYEKFYVHCQVWQKKREV